VGPAFQRLPDVTDGVTVKMAAMKPTAVSLSLFHTNALVLQQIKYLGLQGEPKKLAQCFYTPIYSPNINQF